MLKVALFTVAKRQKQPNVHRLMNGHMNVVYPHDGILLSRKHEHTGTWYNMGEPRNRHAKGRSQTRRAHIVSHLDEVSGVGKSRDGKHCSFQRLDGESEEMGNDLLNETGASPRGDENVLELGRCDDSTTL